MRGEESKKRVWKSRRSKRRRDGRTVRDIEKDVRRRDKRKRSGEDK